ncbi:hypothetical protein [Streptomyces sp. NPDC005969]
MHDAMRPDVDTPDALRAVIADHLAELRAPRTTHAPTPS